ncbi:glycoside hydrolase family 20 protein [Marinilabilia rubra]|uniref:beta-N-acetylhexosaminidase n=1 Tax=Marinilabilia rubra TaxID=2162893 RepID=A0A2U2B4E1_9BACT|nr:glycoside hydrolase family 20 protein [Marinilabilia rubra]PWD97941.1 beta-N-acetylhexosaminidase [Marinilabilia rubra]
MDRRKIIRAIFLTLICTLGLSVNAQTKVDYRVVPLPHQIFDEAGKRLTINEKSPIINMEPENSMMRRNAEFLAEYIEDHSGIKMAVKSGNKKKGVILLKLGLENENPEAYKIEVNNKALVISGASEAGVFYGIQTLRKAIPVKPTSAIEFPAVTIKDEPRFSYRGMMLDVGRHIFSVDEVKTYIDMLALHNINNFHWHLTEDQGWRIEIKEYPKLTEMGSQRKETVIGRNSDRYDGKPYGGFYTQEEIREIVDYATKRYINVIPEIDMPGHMLGALASYPELGCTGGPYEVRTKWGIAYEVLCVGNDQALEFVKNVLNEVMDLFPSEFIHIGGDECPKTRWEKCPKCQARIEELGLKDDEAHTAEEKLQSYFISYAEKVINERGRRMIGWDEILEGGLAPNATVMSWRGMSGGVEAAKMGHDVVMTPNSHVYFDHYQSTDNARDPLAIGGYSPVERVYALEPVPDELTNEERKHILGAQANLWTEYIPVFEHAQFMVLPRMAALCEVQWMQPEQKNYEDFLSRLMPLIEIYKINDYNYAKHIFDINAEIVPNPKDETIDIYLDALNNGDIYYTLNGTAPVKHSPVYDEVIKIDENAQIKAVTFFDGEKSRVFSEDITFNKATTKPIEALQPVDEGYRFEGISTLVDGLSGNSNYRTGRWIAFRGNDLEAVIDLKKETTIKEAGLTSYVLKGDWIFDMRSFTVQVSDDGKNFETVARKEYEQLGQSDSNGIKKHTLRFDPTEARYVKIIAETEKEMPGWHSGAGKPGYLFVDEIIIN